MNRRNTIKIILGFLMIVSEYLYSDTYPLDAYITNESAYGCYDPNMKRCFHLPLGKTIDVEGLDLTKKVIKMSGYNVTPSFESEWWIQTKFLTVSTDFEMVEGDRIAIRSIDYDSGGGVYKLVNGESGAWFEQSSVYPQRKHRDDIKFYKHNNVYAKKIVSRETGGISLIYIDQGDCIKEMVCTYGERCNIELKPNLSICEKKPLRKGVKMIIDPSLGGDF